MPVVAQSAAPIASVSIVPNIDGVINTFSSISSLGSAATSTLVSYTVPVGKKFYLEIAEVSGENRASYSVLIDSSVVAKKRTYFTKYNTDFSFDSDQAGGLKAVAGEVVKIDVTNNGDEVGDFDGRIMGVLLDA